jgi:hypothetical protein
MATLNRELGMWRASTGGYFGTKEEAEAAEGGAVVRPENDTDAFGTSSVDATGATSVSSGQENRPQSADGLTYLDTGEPTPMAGYRQDLLDNREGVTRIEAFDKFGTPGNVGGTALDRDGNPMRDAAGNALTIRPSTAKEDAEYQARLGTVTSNGMVGGVESLNFEPPATPRPGSGTATNGAATIDAETYDAKDQFQDTQATNAAENDGLWAKAWEKFDNLESSDYAMSDEARGYQREGLQQQRELLERMLGFDPKQYASQFADQALARSIAQGRSGGGGYAAQQAGMFAAQDQMPALQAEGARQAASLENQRLGAAAGVAKTFGDLGTMTRGQDEGRAQFESNLGLSIANSVADLSKGQVQLNQQESQMFAEIWMDFARLQSVYAGMSSQEQIAWWQNETAKRGQDKQFQAIVENIRANGAISDKDLLGGLFQLGGGIISSGGSILAAGAGKAA